MTICESVEQFRKTNQTWCNSMGQMSKALDQAMEAYGVLKTKAPAVKALHKLQVVDQASNAALELNLVLHDRAQRNTRNVGHGPSERGAAIRVRKHLLRGI